MVRVHVALLLLAACAMSAGAQTIYKCRKDGTLTYADVPCPASEVTTLDIERGPSAQAQALARERLMRERAEQDQRDAAYLANLWIETRANAHARPPFAEPPNPPPDSFGYYDYGIVDPRVLRPPDRRGARRDASRDRPPYRVPGRGEVPILPRYPRSL